MVIHLFLHDSLDGNKTEYFLAFLSDFSACVLARFFFVLFSNTLADSRKSKLLDGVPIELLLDTSAAPWLSRLGLSPVELVYQLEK